jgi:hypothetical protein
MIFLINVFNGSKYCPAMLETVCPRVSHRRFMDFILFNVDAKSYNCPLTTFATATNAIGSGIGMFIGSSVSINNWLVFDTLVDNLESSEGLIFTFSQQLFELLSSSSPPPPLP